MNYKLELNKQEVNPTIIFNDIIFDFFKVNIVERYTKSINSNLSPNFILQRSLDNFISLISFKKGKIWKFLKAKIFWSSLITSKRM